MPAPLQRTTSRAQRSGRQHSIPTKSGSSLCKALWVHHLQGKAVWSPARVRRKRRDALAVVQAARKVREAVLVALRLLFALPGASPAVRYDTVSPGWLARRPETSAARSDRLLSSVGTNIRLLALGAQAPRAPTLAGTSDQL